MLIVKKIAENSGVIILGNVLERALNLLITIALARYFGQTGFGKLSFLAIYFFFLASLDNQWIRPILVREMSRDKDNAGRIIGNGLVIKALVSLSAVLFFWITIGIIKPGPDIVILAFFTSWSLLLNSLTSSYEIVFQVSLKMKYFIGLNIFGKILNLVVVCLTIIFKKDLFNFYVLSLIPGILFLVLLRHYSVKIIKPVFKLDTLLWRRIFRESWPLGLTAAFIFIYHRVDQALLLYFKGAEALGLYAVGLRLVEALNIIPLAFMVPMLPILSAYFHSSEIDFRNKYSLSFKYLLILIIPLAIGISLFSAQIIRLFYGEQFNASAACLAILIWSEVFVFVGVVNNTILVSSNKQIVDPLFTGVSALVGVSLNLLLIPRFGLTGAAVTAVISCATGPVMGYFIPLTRDYSKCMFLSSLKPLLASLASIMPIYYFKPDLWLLIIAGPAIYFAVLYLIGGLNKQDIKRLSLVFNNG